MISQHTYDRSAYNKQWAATPEEALQRTNEEIARLTVKLETGQGIRDEQDWINRHSDLKAAQENRKFLIG